MQIISPSFRLSQHFKMPLFTFSSLYCFSLISVTRYSFRARTLDLLTMTPQHPENVLHTVPGRHNCLMNNEEQKGVKSSKPSSMTPTHWITK